MSAMKRKPTTLPDDIDTLKKLVVSLSEDVLSLSKENASLHKKYNKLIEELLLLRQKKFAASSEKPPGQGELFDKAESTLENADASLEEVQEDVVIVKKSSVKSGCKPLPKDLLRKEIIHDIPKNECQCECGDRLHEIGSDISEQLDVIPAKLKIIRHETRVQVLHKKDRKAESLSYMWFQKGGPLGNPSLPFITTRVVQDRFHKHC